jgi:hypothetical protein
MHSTPYSWNVVAHSCLAELIFVLFAIFAIQLYRLVLHDSEAEITNSYGQYHLPMQIS